MRVAVLGAGGVGGVIGARLFQADVPVVLIARGEHGGAIRRRGLTLEAPEGSTTLAVPCVSSPAEVDWGPDDVVLLAVQSQHTASALASLTADVPVVCAQNGVENERVALRRFSRVYGMCVMLPATRLEPGVVQAWSTRSRASSTWAGIRRGSTWPRGWPRRCRRPGSCPSPCPT